MKKYITLNYLNYNIRFQVVSLVKSCPFITQESDTDFFAYKLPVFILLIINSCFLVWILVSSNITLLIIHAILFCRLS